MDVWDLNKGIGSHLPNNESPVSKDCRAVTETVFFLNSLIQEVILEHVNILDTYFDKMEHGFHGLGTDFSDRDVDITFVRHYYNRKNPCQICEIRVPFHLVDTWITLHI